MNNLTFCFLFVLAANTPGIFSIYQNGIGSLHSSAWRIPSPRVTADLLARHFLGRDLEMERTGFPRWRYKRDSTHPHLYDVVYIIDSSGSIGPRHFRRGLKGLQLMISRAKPDTLYAAVTFSNKSEITFPFVNSTEAVKKLLLVTYQAGKTNTQDALRQCREELFLKNSTGWRQAALKRVIIVTDGQSNIKSELTLYRAFQLKSIGAEVFVVAVGQYHKGMEELLGLASSTDRHLFRVTSHQGFLEVVKLIPPWPKTDRRYRMWIKKWL